MGLGQGCVLLGAQDQFSAGQGCSTYLGAACSPGHSEDLADWAGCCSGTWTLGRLWEVSSSCSSRSLSPSSCWYCR